MIQSQASVLGNQRAVTTTPFQPPPSSMLICLRVHELAKQVVDKSTLTLMCSNSIMFLASMAHVFLCK